MPALPSNCIGKLAKNNDIVKDLTRFEPETDPMPSNGKVGIGYPMPSVGIKWVWHWQLNACLSIKLYREIG
jgi:hypothetical protein